MSLFGKLTGSDKANKQIKKAQAYTEQAKKDAIGAINTGYDTGMGYLNPYTQMGTAALGQGMAQAGYNQNPDGSYSYGGVEASPLYQFQLGEMMRDMPRLLGARSNSTYGQRQMSNYLQGLYASEAERQRGQNNLMMNMGYGAAGSATNMANQRGQTLAGLYTGTAQNMSGLYGQKGQLATSYSPFNIATSIANTAAGFVPFAGGGSQQQLTGGAQNNGWQGASAFGGNYSLNPSYKFGG